MQLLAPALALGTVLAAPAVMAQDGQKPVAEAADAPPLPDPYVLVEEFTADTLGQGEAKIGTDLEVGLTRDVMVGVDLVALAVGAPSLQAKWRIAGVGEHRFALGLRAAYLSKKTFLWGSVDEHFEKLEAKIVRPSISWTHELSPRLKLHTFWAKGLGTIEAELSEKGRRKLWETKHPGEDYVSRHEDASDADGADDGKDDDGATDGNQEKISSEQSSLTQQSIQVQSITGLARDRFQLTGEYSRESGNKVLVTSRIEQTTIEDLKSNFFRLTIAHQWVWPTFQFRLGIGTQYFVMTGRDLDGEVIDETGVQPASDIGFYWRF